MNQKRKISIFKSKNAPKMINKKFSNALSSDIVGSRTLHYKKENAPRFRPIA